MLKEHEFRIGRSCAAAITHLRSPRGVQEPDSFAAWTRAENDRVKALAGLFFPGAVDFSSRFSASARDLARNMLASGTPVANARFANGTASCVVDFATLSGATLRIYQVVPKCIDLDEYRAGAAFTTAKGAIRAEWRDHFQMMALRLWIMEKQPSLGYDRILPFFILPVSGAVSKIEGLHSYFEKTGNAWKLTASGAALPAADFLRQIGIAKECAELVPGIAQQAIALNSTAASAVPKRSYACKNCDVLEACWGPLARVSPHIFDLGYLWFAKNNKGERHADILIRDNRVSLSDLPEDEIMGDYAVRQRMQLEGERTGQDIILPGLADELAKLSYPIHGLDIETIRSLTPVHRGSKVNGLTLFQFSVTHQQTAGGPLSYHDWLNTAPENPNRVFLAELRAALGDTGSVLVYSPYEENSFRELLCELITAGDNGDDALWLKAFLDSGRLIDLHRIIFANFWAKGFGGKTSIKTVLPALWAVDSPVKLQVPFRDFTADIDPYANLKLARGVTDGCTAMGSYAAMQGASGNARDKIAGELRRYVRVDSIAMNFVLDFLRWRLTKVHVAQEPMTRIAA